jgi:hypothetical protein
MTYEALFDILSIILFIALLFTAVICVAKYFGVE